MYSECVDLHVEANTAQHLASCYNSDQHLRTTESVL